MTLFSKSKNLKELLKNPRKNLNQPEPCIIFHTTLLLELTNQLVVCVLSIMHCLWCMPNTLPQIIDILLRFQLNRIALTSDKKTGVFECFNTRVRYRFFAISMGTGIWVQVIYSNGIGTTASQFLVAFAISKHLNKCERTNPLFVEKFLENLYVDDSINRVNTGYRGSLPIWKFCKADSKWKPKGVWDWVG